MTVEQAASEVAEIDKQISGLQEQKGRLVAFIEMSGQLDSEFRKGTSQNDAKPEVARRSESVSGSPARTTFSGRTADTAWEVLTERGKLRLLELVKAMRERGWKGTGDDLADKNAVYAAMHRLPHNFTACGQGYWKAKKS